MDAVTSEHRSTVLAVDDNATNLELLVRLLGRGGYSVITAECGEDALALVRDEAVDLVILDVMMPGIDGIETCRRIRGELGKPTLPIIIATALTDRDSRRRAKAAGADDFLSKPLDAIELEVRVRNLLAVKAYHDLREQQYERVAAELERTRGQLLRVDRLATAGTLAAGTGHELNNISTVLVGLCDLIEERTLQGLPPDDEQLHQLKRATAHVAVHGRQLLAFGRCGSEKVEQVDLRSIVRDTMAMLKLTGRTACVDVHVDLPDTPVIASVDRTRIEQVLVNLVGNAADALRDTADSPQVWITCAGPDGEGRLHCRVEDNGPGIPPAQREAVFEPYYTTKPPGQGTGLGLPVVRQIVRACGGEVTTAPREGGGAAFAFWLPAASSSSIAA